MKSLSRPPTPRTQIAWLLLLALLLPLLAACGAGSPNASTNAPISGGGTAATAPASGESMGALATAAPAADSGGGVAAAAPTAASMEAISAPSGDTAGVAAPEIAARPSPVAPPRTDDQQQFVALKAGEVDDNADFASYLAYLRTYNGPPARQVDVADRFILTVVNDKQQPVLDARVRLFDGDRQIFEGHTYAGGKTIILPNTLGVAGNQSLRLLVDKGNSTAQAQPQFAQETQTVVLPSAEALPQTTRLDVLFLLDATGSMGDEIGQIQNTIVSIAERIDQIKPRPELRFGLVTYRDHGDEYVTRVNDFTADVGAFRQILLNVSAGGGGDMPEALNEGLHAAIQEVHWDTDAVRLTFLVADAPPHLDYQDYDYVQETQMAVAQGIKVYTIAASNSDDEAEYVFRQLAQQTLAHFIFLTYQPGQESGPPGDTTTHSVDPQSFTVERLDDLVVQVVQRELAQAIGSS
jgi:uncharacterized protein YegL